MSDRPVVPPRRPLIERLTAQQNQINTPMECERCGGTFFISQSVQQFGRGGYGSAEFRNLTSVATTVKICLCGYVIGPSPSSGKGGAGTDRESFYVALERAQKFFKSQDLEQLVQVAASKRELQELKAYFEDRLGSVTSRLTQFEDDTAGALEELAQSRAAVAAEVGQPQEEPVLSVSPAPKKGKKGTK